MEKLNPDHYYFNKTSRATQLQKKGKQLVEVCCKQTASILEDTLKFGVTKTQFRLFIDFFKGHPLTDFGNSDYTKEGLIEIDIDRQLDDIFTYAKIFSLRKLEAFFLEKVLDDVKQQNERSASISTLLSFNKVFAQRRIVYFQKRYEEDTKTQSDKKYQLSIDSPILDSQLFRKYEHLYNKHGFCCTREGFTMYNPYFTTVIFTNKINVFDLETKSDVTINGTYFWESFKAGYLEGEKEFKQDYPTDVFYTKEAEYLVRKLHEMYFHRGVTQSKGWNYQKTFQPLILSSKNVFDFGRYSGILAALDTIIDKFKDKFDEYNFMKCRTEEQEPINELTTRSQKVFEALNKYGLDSSLKEQGYSPRVFVELTKKLTKDFMPFSIALLYELGFLEYMRMEHFNGHKGNTVKELSNVFKVSERRIRGNWNILSPNSIEDGTNYASSQHRETIRKKLKGLR